MKAVVNGWRERAYTILAGIGLVVLLAVSFPQTTVAQTTCGASDIKPLLEKVEKAGGKFVCVDMGAKKAEPDLSTVDRGAKFLALMIKARERFRELVLDSGAFLSNMDQALAKHSPRGSLGWLLHAFVIGIVGVAVGLFASVRLRNWGQSHFAKYYNPEPQNRAEKLGYLLFRAFMMGLGVVLMVLVAMVIVLALDLDNRSIRVTASVIVFCVASVRVINLIFFNILAPDVPTHRVIDMSDTDAANLYRSTVWVAIFASALLGMCGWMDQLGLNQSTHKLMLVGASFITAILFAALFLRYRKPIARAVANVKDGQRSPLWRRIMAATLHVWILLYLVLAWLVSSIRIILDLPGSVGLVGAPLFVMIMIFAIYAFLLVIIDQFFKRRLDIRRQLFLDRVAQAEQTSAQETASASTGASAEEEPAAEETANGSIEEERDLPDVVSRPPIFRDWMEHGAAILVFLIGVGTLLDMWGLDFSSESHPLIRFLDVVLVCFIAYMAYKAVKIWVDSKIEEEEPLGDDEADSETEIGGAGVSRLATLLPIFRNFLLITILVIAGMIVLSEMGVDIGPLFAGAGVVGLAIGFGAQALIRDIFSGAFFLMDDAFRRGEYINLGSIQGVVEKISIRSFQLRHHNGPLHTVPFGEIKQLTNFSRDWVIMKLKLRVTYDTDVERVRKLIKKLGQELLSDPDIGPMFLEPLKSQGVVEMDDSAMIIRVKFMTKPGDQFMARRVVYTKIRELFEREGIHFAHREVTVRVADLDRPLTEEEKTKVAGAVRPVLDQPGGEAVTKDDSL